MRRFVLLAFSLSGASALIYEVTWTRALTFLMGSTTFAVSTMLSTFMAGLALGGYLGGRLADRGGNLLRTFALLELGIGVFGLVTVPLINSLPPVYFVILKSFSFSPRLYFTLQFVLCAAVMLVPTTLMGATFPVVSKALTSSLETLGKWVGNAYSFNTLGAIIGSFSAGFLLIPFLGVKATTMVAASLNVLVAVFMLFKSTRGPALGRDIAILLLLASLPLSLALLSKPEQWPVTFYMAGRYQDLEAYRANLRASDVLLDREFREGRVKIWMNDTGLMQLNVAGKHEGTGPKDIANTLLAAYIPIASHPAPRSILTIGLGTGFTLMAARQHVPDLALAEINRGVVEGVGSFGPPGLLDGVEVAVNDGRNYLFLSGRKFDIITSTPSYPSEASVGGLFTLDYYTIASEHLTPGGIYCQWLPYYAMSNDDVTIMLKTFSAVFPNVYLWKVEHSLDLIMVGSMSPFAFDAQEIRQRVEGLNVLEYPLPFTLSRTPGEVASDVRGAPHLPVNTDDHPIIEFHVAGNLLTGVKD